MVANLMGYAVRKTGKYMASEPCFTIVVKIPAQNVYLPTFENVNKIVKS